MINLILHPPQECPYTPTVDLPRRETASAPAVREWTTLCGRARFVLHRLRLRPRAGGVYIYKHRREYKEISINMASQEKLFFKEN